MGCSPRGTKFSLRQTCIRTTDGNAHEQFRLYEQWDAHRGGTKRRLRLIRTRTTDGNDVEQFRLHEQWDFSMRLAVSAEGLTVALRVVDKSFAKVRTSRPETANYQNG